MNQPEYFIGVDIGGTNIKTGLVGRDGKVIHEESIRTEASEGISHVLDRIGGAILDLIRIRGKDVYIKGVGIGVAGQVETETGIMLEAPNLPGCEGIPIGQELSVRINVPITLDNDANLAALAEFCYGAGRGVTEMLMVTLGTGVGGGLILRGKIYHGAKGGAGEFGHIIVQRDGALCGCGRRGCVEAYVGTQGILRQVQEELASGRKSVLKEIEPENLTPRHVGEAGAAGDVVAIAVLREVGIVLGIGLGSVANLLNIQRVVVGGGVANAGDLILAPARESLYSIALAGSADIIDVVPAELGERAGIIGAAKLAMLS